MLKVCAATAFFDHFFHWSELAAAVARSRLFGWLSPFNPNRGKPHPLADKRLHLIWLRVRDKDTFAKVADIIENGAENPETGRFRGGVFDLGGSFFIDSPVFPIITQKQIMFINL